MIKKLVSTWCITFVCYNYRKMDPIHVAIKLKHLLILHNKICEQMQELDNNIAIISRQLLLNDLDPQRTDTSMDYLHLSVANGVRDILNQTKHELLTKVKKLSSLITSSLQPEQTTSATQTTLMTEISNSPVVMDTAAMHYTTITQMCFRND